MDFTKNAYEMAIIKRTGCTFEEAQKKKLETLNKIIERKKRSI